MKLSLIALSLVVGLSACDAYAGGHATAPAVEANGILTDANGMSLHLRSRHHDLIGLQRRLRPQLATTRCRCGCR